MRYKRKTKQNRKNKKCTAKGGNSETRAFDAILI